MPNPFAPFSPKLKALYHGGDYNPDQWLKWPEIIEEDIRLMKLAGCNAMSVGIFSWSALEPREGEFTFGWLDDVLEKFERAEIYAIIATPSGARPPWMSRKHPEVLRVGQDRVRNLYGVRHNHCYTSPVYREKVRIINTKLAERYGNHPTLLMWHLSNEYGGACHCPLCQEAFRGWLRNKYGTLDTLNDAWWGGFWSHVYTEWEEIESPAPHGETLVHGMNLDWQRFVTDQTVDFMRKEIEPLKRIAPDIPVTTNFMGTYPGLNYWKFADHLDVISWDNYPAWHGIGEIPNPRGSWDPEGRDWHLASDVGFVHDLNRALKRGKPFMLMESTPSMTNWMSVSKLKRPGVHILSSLQAVAHGSDTVQYFQWRKSRGASEKLHGAVVDHEGTEKPRVFREVARLGEILSDLADVTGSAVPVETALIYDWENRWAIDDAKGPRNDGLKNYERTCKDHYFPLWSSGIPVDVIDMDADFSGYRLVIAPMLYMVRPGVARRLEEFVERGGHLVCTYWSGIVDENDLCFLGGFPGPLRSLLGVWAEEIDSLYPSERRRIVMDAGADLDLKGDFEARHFCEVVHSEGAKVLGSYAEDFYKGMPALTVNYFGKGRAWYMASRNGEDFLDKFYRALSSKLGLSKPLSGDVPEGVSVRARANGTDTFLFVMNFTADDQVVELDEGGYEDIVERKGVSGKLLLEPYGVTVLRTGAPRA